MTNRLAFLAAFIGLSGLVNLHAQIIVSDNFADGDRTNNPAWFISGGTFNVSFTEANNNNSSVNQFFTTSFAPVDLDDQDGLRLTMSYRPEGTNLATVKVGLFDGVAPTVDGWAQFTAGQPTRDWRGYLASIGVDGSSPTVILRNDNAIDDHAFFTGTTIGATGTTITVAGAATFRVIRFEIYRSGVDMVLEVYEGATVDTLTSLGQATDLGAPFFGEFNNLAFFQTTPTGNGHIRYDNITLETFVTGSPIDEPVMSILPGGAGNVLVTLSNLTVGLVGNLWSGTTTDIPSGVIVTSFPVVTGTETLSVSADEPVKMFWSTIVNP
ncbi:MAG TPA: hypothetical protein PKE26_00675 [Kiritimatiellia bacterium]|nr:hypothetical protein [Kiritimatiellia bacterium]HMO97606.1 hypothetical protein [Kiritimatiellia bacterium]HMP95966.1 hypothetical protein [Kiritimatiellia bacterium]